MDWWLVTIIGNFLVDVDHFLMKNKTFQIYKYYIRLDRQLHAD